MYIYIYIYIYNYDIISNMQLSKLHLPPDKRNCYYLLSVGQLSWDVGQHCSSCVNLQSLACLAFDRVISIRYSTANNANYLRMGRFWNVVSCVTGEMCFDLSSGLVKYLTNFESWICNIQYHITITQDRLSYTSNNKRQCNIGLASIIARYYSRYVTYSDCCTCQTTVNKLRNYPILYLL